MHQRLLPFLDNEFNLTLLGAAILHNLDRPLRIDQIEQLLGELRMRFYKGEIQEVVWRLTAARKLAVLPDGRIQRTLISDYHHSGLTSQRWAV